MALPLDTTQSTLLDACRRAARAEMASRWRGGDCGPRFDPHPHEMRELEHSGCYYRPPQTPQDRRPGTCSAPLWQKADFDMRAGILDELAKDPSNAKLKAELNEVNNKIAGDYARRKPRESANNSDMGARNDAQARLDDLQKQRRAAFKKPHKQFENGWDGKRAAIADIDRQIAAEQKKLNTANANVARDLEDGHLENNASPRRGLPRAHGDCGRGIRTFASNCMDRMFKVGNLLSQLFPQGGVMVAFGDRNGQPQGHSNCGPKPFGNYFG